MKLIPRLLVSAPVLLGAVACDANEPNPKLEIAAIDAQHAREKAALERAQADFNRRWRAPFTLEFPGAGTIQIGECALQGYDEHVELRLRYTYINTTGAPIRGVRITVDLVDPVTKNVTSFDSTLHFPPLIPFEIDSSYTTTVNLPTRGLHLTPGWEWRIRPELVERMGG